MRVNQSPPEVAPLSKREGKELSMGTSKRPQHKMGETSSVAAVELRKPEFSTCELGRQVMEVDFVQDQDTSVDLMWVVMLPNDVATLFEETLETMISLLVMQHV